MTLSTSFPSDSRLVRRALARDPAAFEALVSRYQRSAYAIVRSLGVGEPSADDVVQEAFLKAFENLSRLRSEDAFGPWFLRIVRNAARDQFRSRRSISIDAAHDMPFEFASAPALERSELRDRVWRIVSELPEPVREVIYLYYYDGESVRSVAKALGLTKSAVVKRMQRGRDLLRARLWAELEETLREMIPSARDWQRRGRRLALVLLGATAGASTARAASIVPSTIVVQKTVAGGFGMGGKKSAVLVGIGICLLLTGIYVVRNRILPRGDELDAEIARGQNPEAAKDDSTDPGATAAARTGEEAEIARAIDLTRPPALAGTVRDADGRPIAGARVVALDVSAWRQPFVESGSGIWDARAHTRDRTSALGELHAAYRKRGAEFAHAESGTDGSFRFARLSAGEYRVLAGHPEHLSSVDTTVFVRADEGTECEIVLAPGNSIRGRVVNDAGEPLDNVRVTARASSERAVRGGARIELLAKEWVRGEFLVASSSERTRRDGRFTIGALPLDRFDLTLSRPDFAETRRYDVVAGTQDLEIVLERGLEVTGRVLDERGDPIPGAVVFLSPVPAERERPIAIGEPIHPVVVGVPDASLPARLESPADEFARFQFRNLLPGDYQLSANHPSHPTWEARVALENESVEVEIQLEPSLAISGTVYAPDGRRVAGARVWIEKDVRGGIMSWGGRDFTPVALVECEAEENGDFELTGIPAGVYRLRAGSEDFAETVLPRVPAGAAGVDIRLEKGATIRGIVVDEDLDTPIVGALVEVGIGVAFNRHPGKVATTDQAGRFEIPGVPRRSVYLRASHDEYPELPERIRIRPGYTEREIEIRLRRPDTIRGIVVDEEGNPVARAVVMLETGRIQTIYLRRDVAAGLRRAVTAPDGSFSLRLSQKHRQEQWAPSTIVARHARFGIGRTAPLVGPGEGEPWPEIEIVLAPPSSITGRVVGSGGAAVLGARVHATRMELVQGEERDTAVTATTYSGANGAYRLDGIEPGIYLVDVRATEFAPLVGQRLEMMDSPLSQDFRLESGFRVDGRVVDTAGLPIEGAEVLAFPTLETDEDPSHVKSRARREETVGSSSARTDRDGHWSLANLPRGETTLVARIPGYLSSDLAMVEPGDHSLELVVEEFASVSGAARDGKTGQPVSAFEIALLRPEDHRSRFKGDAYTYPTREFAAPSGTFLVEDIPAGRYTVGISAHGYGIEVAEVVLRPGDDAAVEFVLRRGRRVVATVFELESNRRLSDISIGLSPVDRNAGERLHMPNPYRGVTDENGVAILDGLVDGKFRVRARHPEYRLPDERLEFQIESGDDAVEELTLEIGLVARREGALRGTIQNRHGRDSFGHRLVLVNLDDADAKPLPTTIEFHTGKYERRAIPPGDYEVRFEERILTEEGRRVAERTGGMRYDLSVERFTVLGSVRIVEGATAKFDAVLNPDK